MRSTLVLLFVLALSVPASHGGQLSVEPAQPTTADVITIVIGGSNTETVELGRREVEIDPELTYENQFWIRFVNEPVTPGRYALGALEPGTYEFQVYERTQSSGGGPGSCTQQLVDQITVEVSPAAASSTGRIALVMRAEDRNSAEAVVGRLKPRIRNYWPSFNLGSIEFVPGLEETYAQALLEQPEIEFTAQSSGGSAPGGCDAPFSWAWPGALLFGMIGDFEEPEAAAIVARMLPEITSMRIEPKASKRELSTMARASVPANLAPTAPQVSATTVQVIVAVPFGREALFVQQYLKQPEVLQAWVVD